jgi:hypothetical protein
MFVLIAIVWLGNSAHSVTMHDYSTRERCQAAAQKLIELSNQHRRKDDQLFIAESCVEK